MVLIEWVAVQDADVNLPFPKVVCLDQVDSRREFLLCLSPSTVSYFSSVWFPNGDAWRRERALFFADADQGVVVPCVVPKLKKLDR